MKRSEDFLIMLWSAITLLGKSVIVFHHPACGVILWCKFQLIIAMIKLKFIKVLWLTITKVCYGYT